MTAAEKAKAEKNFKRRTNRKHPVTDGYERKFVKCKRCGNMAFYDYIPYSLSNPLMAAECGHSFRVDYKEF